MRSYGLGGAEHVVSPFSSEHTTGSSDNIPYHKVDRTSMNAHEVEIGDMMVDGPAGCSHRGKSKV